MELWVPVCVKCRCGVLLGHTTWKELVVELPWQRREEKGNNRESVSLGPPMPAAHTENQTVDDMLSTSRLPPS